MLIDSHAHLNDRKFDNDREKVIKSLRDSGIELVILGGSSVSSSVNIVSLAQKYREIYATIGIHPNNAGEMNQSTIEILRTFAKKDKVVAIGEIGLDYHHNVVSKDIQKKWFRKQIQLAKEVNFPIVVHDREANQDTFDIIKEEYDERLKGVLHCYSGDLSLARKYIEMGLYISIAGPVTYRSAHKLKEVAKELPLEYLLIETDSPYLTPSSVGRRRNEPTYVRYVAGAIAELRGITFQQVEKATNENTKRLFNIK